MRDDGPVAYFLGWEIRAVKGSDVLLASVGQGAVVADSPYVALAGSTYVQLAVSGRNSTPEWSHLT